MKKVNSFQISKVQPGTVKEEGKDILIKTVITQQNLHRNKTIKM